MGNFRCDSSLAGRQTGMRGLCRGIIQGLYRDNRNKRGNYFNIIWCILGWVERFSGWVVGL